jgi:diguanylate cyclase (GGDEF)-like protein
MPIFSSGAKDDFPKSEPLDITSGAEPDTNLVSRAIRTGDLVICNDLMQSQPPVARRTRLIERGFKSLLAMPLSIKGRQGALTLASRNINLIGDEEVLLMRDIRSSLMFALAYRETAGAVEYLAYFDALTGLAKRTLFCERLDLALRAAPGPLRNLTIAAFDIHGLANINDSFGRRVGDLLLQRVAERLKRHTDAEERIGYLGGGTFMLCEPGLSATAENIAALLDSTVFGEAFQIEGHMIRVSFLLGVARYPNDGERADMLVQNTEAALKRAKDTGEQYLTYELRMHSEIAERLELEHKLRTALDERQFVLHYQPQVNIASGRIESVEALLRWNDPDHGLVMPAKFLPILEASGLIVPIGAWILERAIADCRRWRGLGLGPVRIAVNISALQLRRRSFVAEVVKLAGDLNGAGYGLDLEITESSLLQDIDATTRKLQELRAAGVRVSLDDFGTGYSSLGLLSRLPVDALKIDRSFISGLPSDPACVALTSSVIQLARAFGLGTVAEGVETIGQMETLRDLRCLQSQGFLYSKPVPLAELELMLVTGISSPGARS